jgi:hypothetical protein
MKADWYFKVVLTVIAICLVWISVGGPSLLPVVEAQPRPQSDVYIVGWRDAEGFYWKLPVTQPPVPPLTSTFDRERAAREREQRGASLPVLEQALR